MPSNDQPHSKTVRGTLSNPKTQEAIENAKANPDSDANRTSLGDPGSLKVESGDSDPVPDRTSQDGGTVGSEGKDGARDIREEDKTHAQSVRGSKL
ncbi:hypothetical protein BU16DRAFT_63513 [Lophium mytilinum]|uniref:Uncharacterized protein n=1 Tax=Lophium mytilinum TaxID=390894 RepID=A0A6A6QT19_9PEZI|nr:hypothetical protein BU16DRAFT_63513 [Lophium mytilinum]